MFAAAATRGLVGGIIGTAVMTLGEKAEQAITGRANSYVPGRTAARLFRLPNPDKDSTVRNWAMHWGTGAVAGALRGVMAAAGLRGPGASAMHFALRFNTDELLENAVGTGSPPWTWPPSELVVDVLHKGVYALATGAAVDALVKRR